MLSATWCDRIFRTKLLMVNKLISSLIIIIRLMSSLLVWPKVITLSSVHFISIKWTNFVCFFTLKFRKSSIEFIWILLDAVTTFRLDECDVESNMSSTSSRLGGSRWQFHQHFMCTFCANIFCTKKLQSQT